ncbi:hypothetical protein ACFQH2_13715 [Natronoarchaeum sp. GCM10025703]|uniref:hypothetical protein n=1 Tax=Natronoarchaeum sp. GCM10025703 TaxID=3252685 RepID=UPI0036119994
MIRNPAVPGLVDQCVDRDRLDWSGVVQQTESSRLDPELSVGEPDFPSSVTGRRARLEHVVEAVRDARRVGRGRVALDDGADSGRHAADADDGDCEQQCDADDVRLAATTSRVGGGRHHAIPTTENTAYAMSTSAPECNSAS